jgi:hypothetical protein
MNSLLDNSLVGLALLASAGYAVASLGPKSVRRRLLSAIARATARAPRFLGLRTMSQRLEASAGKAQKACGGCDSCGSDQSPAAKATQNSPAVEVSVPVAKIGRR